MAHSSGNSPLRRGHTPVVFAQGNYDESFCKTVQLVVNTLYWHNIECEDELCPVGGCRRLRPVVDHVTRCHVGVPGGCMSCMKFYGFRCNHSVFCINHICNVPYCWVLKPWCRDVRLFEKLSYCPLPDLKEVAKLQNIVHRATHELSDSDYAALLSALLTELRRAPTASVN